MATIGAVLLLILQIVGWVLLGLLILVGIVLLLLCIVLVIPAVAKLDYHGDVFTAKVGMLGLYFTVYPLGEKEEPTPEQVAEKAEKKKAKQAMRKARGKKPSFGFVRTLEAVAILCEEAGVVLRLLLGALRITDIRLHMPVHGKDAADTAIQYGKTNAWFYSVFGFLNQFLYLECKEVRFTPVFTENFDGYADFSCKIRAQLFIMVVVLFRLLRMLQTEDTARAFIMHLAGGNKKNHSAAKKTTRPM